MKALLINFFKLTGLLAFTFVLSCITLEASDEVVLSQDCNNATFYYVKVKSQDYWVQMPTVCHSYGYIFQGDPNLGVPFDGDELTRKQILEQVYARSLVPGGTDSPSLH